MVALEIQGGFAIPKGKERREGEKEWSESEGSGRAARQKGQEHAKGIGKGGRTA